MHRAAVAGAGAERLLAARGRRSRRSPRMLDMPLYPRARGRDLLFDVQSVAGRASSRAALRHDALRAARRRGHQEDLRDDASASEHHVTADGAFSWIEVECLGACCNAPMVQINDDYYEDLTRENFAKLLDDLAAGRPVTKGSQTGPRQLRADRRQLTSLTTLYGVDGTRRAANRATRHPPRPRAETGARDARGQGPHLHQSLRLRRLSAWKARARAAAGTTPRR